MNINDRLKRAKAALRGAVCGDIIGSIYEGRSTKDYNFEILSAHSQFTDDTVCSIAVADALVSNAPLPISLQQWCRRYPRAGYGGGFFQWIFSKHPEPYHSFGNGSAMRVSPIGAYATSIDECLRLAEKSASVTHSHPEGIKGAQAVALAIFMSVHGVSKDKIKVEIESRFNYDLSRKYADIQPGYRFEISCQKSVPEAIICFLESEDYESAVRRAVALGGDADTQAAIAGSIAAAYYGAIPEDILTNCMAKLPDEMLSVIDSFDRLIEARHCLKL